MLFTIITVTRNNRAGLSRTAQSMSDQECDDFEWIIIDGNSRDGTKKDLETYAESHGALTISEDDDGPYDAMNKGIDQADGDYILFLNAGDILSQTQTLKKIRDAIWQSQPDFIYGDSWEFSKDRTWYKTSRSHTAIDKGMFTHHQSMLYKRSLIDDQRYDPAYVIAADYDFTLRYLNKAHTCLYIPLPICVFEAGGLSQRNVTLGRKEQFAIRKKNSVTFIPRNAAIYAAQMVSWSFRSCAPGLYWRLKGIRHEKDVPKEN